MNGTLTNKYKLKFSDFNCFDEIAPYAILDYFQDVAGEHASYIGVGFDDMVKKGYYWVLIRTKFEIIDSPKEYSHILCTTWPKKRGRFDFDREYVIKDEEGNLLVKGISKWVIIDANTRRISPCKGLDYQCDIFEEENFAGPFPKIESFDIDGFSKYEGKVDYIDLDHNGHVNNIAYARYISNALALQKEEKIKYFEINYNKELKSNEEYVLYYKRFGKIIKVKGFIKETNEESFVSLIEIK